MNALDCFENDFFGNKRILSGNVLYMWVALCKKLFDVLVESDLYFIDDDQCLTLLDCDIIIETMTEVVIHMKSYELVWQTRVLLFDSSLTSWAC